MFHVFALLKAGYARQFYIKLGRNQSTSGNFFSKVVVKPWNKGWFLAAGRRHNSICCWFIGIFTFTSLLILWTRITQSLLGNGKPRSSKGRALCCMSQARDFGILIDWQALLFFPEFIEMGYFPKWRILRMYFLKNSFILILGPMLTVLVFVFFFGFFL